MINKTRKAQLILLVKERYAEVLLEEQEEQQAPQAPVKATPAPALKAASAEARAAIKDLIQKAKR